MVDLCSGNSAGGKKKAKASSIAKAPPLTPLALDKDMRSAACPATAKLPSDAVLYLDVARSSPNVKVEFV